MIGYNVKCPVCGKENKDVYLEETDGWMECERCYTKVKARESSKTVRIPLFTPEQLTRIVREGKLTVVDHLLL
jgi:hypothetical protein